ncbi:MAG: multidrug efflux RND transporter permease subunit [Terracidiphilus sp.]|nr:multidrug efflux RND transporter permease subunit [Terracidiphilus sp.]MDR3776205.1 multidrug efflux RND transporter permease subunit [Terracidiphilus sp.]
MISKFFIQHPIIAIVISILMVIVGAVSMVSLPVAQYPEIVPPEILTQAIFPGADAKTLEQSVATPIESQMSGVDNLNYMYSTNASNGWTQLITNFDISTSPNIDQILTQLRVNQAAAQLPAEVSAQGVQVQKSLTTPLLMVNLVSPHSTYSQNFLNNYATINLKDELSRLPGVGRVQVFGGDYAMRVWVKPDQLAKLAVTVPEITAAIATQNKVNPSGQIGGQPVPKGQEFTYTVRSQGRLESPEEFGNIVIRANPDGTILHLKDVARIELGAQSYNISAKYNGADSGAFAIYQLPGSNAVEAAANVRVKLTELSKRFPADMQYFIPYDSTEAVSAGLHEIEITLFESLLLVILVVYVFLQGWRAALIPLAAIPVSLVGTFIVFPMLGFSINTLSLFGLVLAIGLVVDDAIVVVEAVEHHIEEGLEPREATMRAMEEVSGPVIAIALILSAVFIPTAFIPGITGKLYQQFAVTIAVSVIFSAFNALTLSPALCALLLKPGKVHGPFSRFFDWFNATFTRAQNGYIRGSALMIRRSAFSMIFLALMAGVAWMIGGHLPTSFVPEEDQKTTFVRLQLPHAASLQRTEAAAKKVEEIVLHTPGVDNVATITGLDLFSSTQNPYTSFFFVGFKNWDERHAANLQASAIENQLNKSLSAIPDGTAVALPPPAIPGIGSSGGVTFVLEDRSGTGGDFLANNTDAFLAALRRRPEIAVAFSTFIPHVPQLYVDVDKEKVMRQHMSIDDVYTTMQTFMGGYMVNYFNRFGRQWQVYVEAEGDYRTDPKKISQFYVTNPSGNMVPLDAVAKIELTTGPEFTMHFNEYPAAQIMVTAAPGYSSGQTMKVLQEVFAQTMPSQMAYDYMGMSYQEQKAAKGISPAAIFGLSLLFVFLILTALYESWSLPFSVLLSTPVAMLGGYLALWSRGLENNVYAQIGMVMLIGLAAKNAILIVEFAKLEHDRGKNVVDAALAGARLRLRPIIMTSFAFILACIPLWIAQGSGAVGRRMLGTTVIGGMLAATGISIFLIPVTFTIFERLSLRFRSKHQSLPDDGEQKGEQL